MSQLDLRRVLFELLVMCGMDRELGFTRKVYAQGRPDAVSEAQYYLKHVPGQIKSFKYGAFWMSISNIALLTIVGYIIWRLCTFYNTQAILLIVAAIALYCCTLYFFSPRDIETDLSTDKIYNTWLSLLLVTISKDVQCGLKSSDTLQKGSLKAKYGSAWRIISSVTNYQTLGPSGWQKSTSRSWMRYTLLGIVAILYLVSTSPLFAGNRSAIPPIGMMFAMGMILPEISLWSGRSRPISLCVYLVQHLLTQIQQEEGSAVSALVFPALVS